ncbi:trehalose synthase [Leptobacterium flavescens]|uniref:Trehalose synthase n=1 Tax=Leptobacterium flavescens TaxID=472055 RepID=A0A6P0UNP6_9FLAO|nr:trehalose synthase [Leptobacterium flavescens]NER14070.1 trehalose synthase [Leptobacterium flavescens]
MADSVKKAVSFNTPFNFKTSWEKAFQNEEFVKVFSEDILENYIVNRRWYAGKASTLKYIEVVDFFKIESKIETYFGVLLEVNFQEAFFQNYFMPLAFCPVKDLKSGTTISEVSFNGKEGYLMDAIHKEEFRKLLFEKILGAGEENPALKVRFHKGEAFKEKKYEGSRFMGVEQSNTSIIYNDRFVLKFFRRIYINTNPDYEINRFLTERKKFGNTPAYTGSVNLHLGKDDDITLALMQELVPNQGDAWEYMLKELDKVFNNLKTKNIRMERLPEVSLFKRLKITDIPPEIIDWAGLNIFMKVKQLALRTAEMHIALGSDTHDTAFTPTTYNSDYTVWLKNRLIYQFQNRLNTIENNLHKLDGLALELAKQFLDRKKLIRKHFLDFDWTRLKSERIRIHGDYHLGQVLVNGEDFYILDFEGEPESTIRDRKVKQPPMKDVAGMFRSFHYAIYSTIFTNMENYSYDKNDLFRTGEILYRYLTGVFLETYIEKAQRENLNIGYIHEIEFLLKYCLLEKAVYELGYELNSRPRWAVIPLEGIASIMNYN